MLAISDQHYNLILVRTDIKSGTIKIEQIGDKWIISFCHLDVEDGWETILEYPTHDEKGNIYLGVWLHPVKAIEGQYLTIG